MKKIKPRPCSEQIAAHPAKHVVSADDVLLKDVPQDDARREAE
jgi:hypothetical protein